MFIENEFYKEYKIITGKSELFGYREKHHIIPKSLGGKNEIENYVYLSAANHLRAHTLLPFFTMGENKNKVIYAWNWMTNRTKITDFDEYEELRKLHGEIHSEKMTGRKCAEETKRKIGEANKGNKPTKEQAMLNASKRIYKNGKDHPGYGKNHSQETRNKISKNHARLTGEDNSFYGKHHSDESKQKMRDANLGRVHSEETKQKMSEAQKGRKRSEETNNKIKETWKSKPSIICPHCGLVGKSEGPMSRWHFENCKLKGKK